MDVQAYHCFVNRIGGFVGKYACRQTRDDFRDLGLVTNGQNVVVDLHVDALCARMIGTEQVSCILCEKFRIMTYQEVQIVGHVVVKASDHCGQMNDMRRPVKTEQRPSGRQIADYVRTCALEIILITLYFRSAIIT